MKRGRKSKAEKAAMAAAAAAEAAADLTTESNSNLHKGEVLDARHLVVRETESRMEFSNKMESALDSEDTLSAAGGRSTPAVPKSETSDRDDLNGVVENGNLAAHFSEKKNVLSHEFEDGLDSLGDVNGAPKECICEQNNLMGMQLPMSGYEGGAILHSGSVLRIGCIVLLFTRVD